MLRSRLPQGGQTFPWKPWTSGREDSHLPSRYSFLHSHFRCLQNTFQYPFFGLRNALLPSDIITSAASVCVLAPLYLRRRYSRPVSYYALFQGMAASKPTSWLSGNIHLLSHSDMIWDLSRRSGLFPSRPWTLSSIDSLPDINIWYSKFA